MRVVVRMWNQPGSLVMMHSGIPGSPCFRPRIRLRSLVEDIDDDIGKRYDPDGKTFGDLVRRVLTQLVRLGARRIADPLVDATDRRVRHETDRAHHD
jgi:hypothetical protein